MEDLIFEAATKGDVNTLRGTKGIDLILNKFVAGCFNWTPLHVAASFGHKDFAQELLTRNPELTRALDSQGRSPLHLAAQKGNVDIVELLLNRSSSSESSTNRDQAGRTPLHVAAVSGRVEVLWKLLGVKMEVARYRFDRDENILHLCVEHQQFDSLKLLLETITDEDFVNTKDHRGNTILHTAVYERNSKVIEFVLDNTQIEVNAKNVSAQTAFDVALILGKTAKGGDKLKLNEIMSFLRGASGKKGIFVPSFNWLDKKDILMVVSSLMAATSFQALISPPGGFWQDDKDGHRAGESVLASHNPELYFLLVLAYTVILIISLFSMLLIISLINSRKVYLSLLMFGYMITACLLAFCSGSSIHAVTPFRISPSLPIHLQEKLTRNKDAVVRLLYFVTASFGLLFLIYMIIVFFNTKRNRRELQRTRALLARLKDPHSFPSGVSPVGPGIASSVGPRRVVLGIP